ncbi:MAG: hypothetical protein UV59_C0012G0049 [Candidatus Gottesmanbacteria bacterium GW2011_GWA1_43_11]|uniref:Uncharacterized protein n=1 Tax=Candidatus Gottesmanbacteria bacterium GW2011_GWA1_43_11 TaxID=1618436 RepID=A0A0G1EPK5_9BACT|nr:MAG: hypothetical protein UV59_C0012G0049 [Candidatus Gottesmanbacteria bacterium GW2011_GWA1_43_11]
MAQQKDLNKKNTALHLAILRQMVTLATSGFGLVAALAWNNVIQDLVNNHIKPYLPQGSSLLSLFIYALVVTTLAVFITYNLTKLVKRLENPEKIEDIKKKN